MPDPGDDRIFSVAFDRYWLLIGQGLDELEVD